MSWPAKEALLTLIENLQFSKQAESSVSKPRYKPMGNVTMIPFIFTFSQISEPKKRKQFYADLIKIQGLLPLGSKCVSCAWMHAQISVSPFHLHCNPAPAELRGFVQKKGARHFHTFLCSCRPLQSEAQWSHSPQTWRAEKHLDERKHLHTFRCNKPTRGKRFRISYMVLVHSMTPLIPSFAEMVTSATNPWVSGKRILRLTGNTQKL